MEVKDLDTFSVLVIESNTIEEFDWASPDYISSLLKTNYCKFHKVPFEKQSYLQKLGLLLKYYDYNQPIIETHIFSIQKEYIYEIINMIFEPKSEDIEKMKPNGIGMLFDLQGDPIFNNVILQKYKNPIDGSPKKYEDITNKDLEHIMYKRIHTTVVVYEDDNFREEEIPGPIEKYAEIFFEGEEGKYKMKELSFLKHNINIWYLEDNDLGTKNICGKLIEDNPKIFKCLFFTKITDDRRDNLTYEELEKIIKLSNKLEDFNPTKEQIEGIHDETGKKIVKNKYEILWESFNLKIV